MTGNSFLIFLQFHKLWIAVQSVFFLASCSKCAPTESSKGVTSFLSFLDIFFFNLMVFASDIDRIIAEVLGKSKCTGLFLNNMILSLSKANSPSSDLPLTTLHYTHLWPVNGWHISRAPCWWVLVCLTFCSVWNQIKQNRGNAPHLLSRAQANKLHVWKCCIILFVFSIWSSCTFWWF